MNFKSINLLLCYNGRNEESTTHSIISKKKYYCMFWKCSAAKLNIYFEVDICLVLARSLKSFSFCFVFGWCILVLSSVWFGKLTFVRNFESWSYGMIPSIRLRNDRQFSSSFLFQSDDYQLLVLAEFSSNVFINELVI